MLVQDFEIDVNYLATVHASALSTLPAPALVMNGSKILAMFSPELRVSCMCAPYCVHLRHVLAR